MKVKRIARLVVSVFVRGWDVFAGLFQGQGSSRPGTCVVLYYHAVPDGQKQRFSRQMDELLRKAKPIALDQLKSLTPGAHHVAVTFDDGYVSVLANAVPELERRRIPCAMFVPSGCMGSRPSWVRDSSHGFWNERVLSPEELRSFAASPLITVGSHSVTHPKFPSLSPEAAANEFALSKAAVEEVLDRPVRSFSFPHGAQNPRLLNQAREIGYEYLFTSEPVLERPSPDQFVFGRVGVNPDDWPLEFRLKLSGAYRWCAHLHAFQQKLSLQ